MASTSPFLFPISERVAFLSRIHIGTTIALLGLCLIPFFARIYIRVWPVWRFGWDDGFIVAGLVRLAYHQPALYGLAMFCFPSPLGMN